RGRGGAGSHERSRGSGGAARPGAGAGAAMLSRLLKEHQARQSERKELQGEARPGPAARRPAARPPPWIAAPLGQLPPRPGVARAYVNQRKLDHEVKTLQIQAAQFAKQTGQWITMVENFNQALKEIGDVENWARSIEMDMRTIATALEYVYKGQLQPSCS
ncbi:BL1S1 protein, partial [Dromaius novaehollandiae]|nr:BL1S1 protein [Dromaius novaehollandiae]